MPRQPRALQLLLLLGLATGTTSADLLGQAAASSSGPVRAAFDAQARLRAEAWENFGFGSAPGRDDTFVLGRVLAGVDLGLGDHVRVYVQARSSFLTDRDLPGGNRPIDDDPLGLQNGYLDVSLPLTDGRTFVTRAGRQELLLGHERLVSPLDWANTRRTFDAIRAIVRSEPWTVHAFFARPVLPGRSGLNPSDDDTDFFGVYAARAAPEGGFELDVYWLGLDRESVSFNGTAGEEERHTLGGRFGGSFPSGWDFDVEAALQTGDLSGADVSALMIGSSVGRTFGDAPWTPRLEAGFDFGSGDDEAGGDVETFDQLFPLGHAYLGFLDAIGRQNVIAARGRGRVSPLPRLSLSVDVHRFWRASGADALYDAGGNVLRAAAPGASRSIGTELDLQLVYRLFPGLVAVVGYDRLFAGPFLEDTGESEDARLAFLMLEWTS